MSETVSGGVNANMRKGSINIKDGSKETLFAPNAKDSLYDKNDAGMEYENKGGVGHKDNLGGENTRS